MLLTIILISLPVGLLSFFFSKKIFKKLVRLLGKIDTFDALLVAKKRIIHFSRTFLARFSSRIRKNIPQDVSQKHIHHHEQNPVDTVEDIIKPKETTSKYLFDPEVVADDEENRTTMIKKRKLLEKIIYDALGLRKEGKLDEYEKKINE